jgi:hypothetical protein
MPGSSALIATGLIRFRPDDNNLTNENKNLDDKSNIKKENCCSYLSNCIHNCVFCCFMCFN